MNRVRGLAVGGRRNLAAALLAPLLVLSMSCFSEDPGNTGPDDDEGVVVIEMTSDLTFEPSHVEVEPGQTIRWRNVSNEPHSATTDVSQAIDPDNVVLPAGAASWDSGLLAPGESFDLVLTATGDYSYFCDPHETGGMVGTLEVRAP